MASTTKEEIITKGIQLIRERGFANISVEEICHACEISRGTFYYHFRSKEDIFVEYFKSLSYFSMDLVADSLGAESTVDQLWGLYCSFVDRTDELGRDFLRRLYIGSLSAGESLFKRLIFNLENPTNKIAVALIKKGQKEGAIKSSIDPQSLLWIFNNGFQSLALEWCVGESSFDSKKEIRKFFDLIFLERL